MIKKQGLIILVSISLLVSLSILGCAKEREKEEITGVIEPAHHWGEECAKCHSDWNLIAMHDANSQKYNDECILCHGNMMGEVSLDKNVQSIHPKMMKYVWTITGETEVSNTTCKACHQSVDFINSSAGNIRKQVASGLCAECHVPGGGGKPLYVE